MHLMRLSIVMLVGAFSISCGGLNDVSPADDVRANGIPSGFEVGDPDLSIVILESMDSREMFPDSRYSLKGLSFEYQDRSGKTQYRSALPPSAILTLEDLLRFRIDNCERNSLYSNRTVDDEVANDRIITLTSHRAFNSLLEQSLELPVGLRRISYQEADKLISFVSAKVDTVCADGK